MAWQLRVSRQAVSKREAGQAIPDGETIVALSRLFGVSTDFLLLGEGAKPAPQADAADARREGNRRLGLMSGYVSQAMGLFISLLGVLAAGGFLMQIFSLLGFQLGYQWFPAGVVCGKWRLCYLRGSLWMMAFYPCWLLLGAAWRLLPGPYSGWIKGGSILLAYLAVCLLGDRLLHKRAKERG